MNEEKDERKQLEELTTNMANIIWEKLKNRIPPTPTEPTEDAAIKPAMPITEWLKHANNCPECQKLILKHGWTKDTPNLKEEQKKWEKQFRQKYAPLKCIGPNCETYLFPQDEECPTCKSKKGRPR